MNKKNTANTGHVPVERWDHQTKQNQQQTCSRIWSRSTADGSHQTKKLVHRNPKWHHSEGLLDTISIFVCNDTNMSNLSILSVKAQKCQNRGLTKHALSKGDLGRDPVTNSTGVHECVQLHHGWEWFDQIDFSSCWTRIYHKQDLATELMMLITRYTILTLQKVNRCCHRFDSIARGMFLPDTRTGSTP